jgi:hypothetical protein
MELVEETRLECFGEDWVQFVGGMCSDRGIESLVLVSRKREIMKVGIQHSQFRKFNLAIAEDARPVVLVGWLGKDANGYFLSKLGFKLSSRREFSY